MTALFLAPIYLFLCFYLIRWGIHFMGACSHHFKKTWVRVIILALYTILVFSILIAFFLPPSPLQRIMKLISNYWLGTLMYTIPIVIFVDLGRFILKYLSFVNQEKLASKKLFVLVGTICITLISGLSIWGIVNARILRTTPYEVTVRKDGGKLDSLNVILVADLHLGYNTGTVYMENMVRKINNQDADLVVFAGDIFDNEYEALDDPEKLVQIFKKIKSKYGVYACYGNHDIEEPILAGFTFRHNEKKQSDRRMDKLLEDSNIQLLRDESVLIDNSFYLVGRPDMRRPGRGIDVRKTPAELTKDLNLSKPILVIDHQPKELEELSLSGVDVDFSGHTHDGQMAPGNLLTSLMWENSCGYLKKGNMHSIVTSGVGVFGPNMRVGTKSEICTVKIHFNEKADEKPNKVKKEN